MCPVTLSPLGPSMTLWDTSETLCLSQGLSVIQISGALAYGFPISREWRIVAGSFSLQQSKDPVVSP